MADLNEIIKIIKAERKKAEYILLHYDEVLKKYNEAKAEYLSRDYSAAAGGAKSSATESAAIKSIEFDRKQKNYKWLKAVEIVQRGLSERKNLFIKARRAAEKAGKKYHGRRVWVTYTQQRYRQEIEKHFINEDGYLSERTIKTWWYSIIAEVVLIASKIK